MGTVILALGIGLPLLFLLAQIVGAMQQLSGPLFWIGRMVMQYRWKRRKEWPVKVIVQSESGSIGPTRGIISTAIMQGHVDLEFCLIPHHVPVVIQEISLRYKGNWFVGERTELAPRPREWFRSV